MDERRQSCRPRSGASPRILAGALSLLVIAAVACGSDDNVDTGGSGSATPLQGTTWLLAPAAELGVDIGTTAVTTHFESGTVSGVGGCNGYTGTYKLDGSSLTIGPNLVQTQMSCGEVQDAVEKAFLGRLTTTASYKIDGDQLTLTDSDGKTLLPFVASDPARAILGKWDVTSYYSGDAITSVVGGVDLTAEFTADAIAGNTGCNQFNGPYQLDRDNITIGPLAATKAACTSEELSKQESDYLAALALAKTVAVAGDRLDLLREGGTIAVTLVKA
jgi:heat shock protein HslJ